MQSNIISYPSNIKIVIKIFFALFLSFNVDSSRYNTKICMQVSYRKGSPQKQRMLRGKSFSNYPASTLNRPPVPQNSFRPKPRDCYVCESLSQSATPACVCHLIKPRGLYIGENTFVVHAVRIRSLAFSTFSENSMRMRKQPVFPPTQFFFPTVLVFFHSRRWKVDIPFQRPESTFFLFFY